MRARPSAPGAPSLPPPGGVGLRGEGAQHDLPEVAGVEEPEALIIRGPANPGGAVVRRFGSLQPLIALKFLVHRPALVGVAEYGLLCAHAFTGEEEWQQQLWTNVGDMSLTGDGQTILLACTEIGRLVGDTDADVPLLDTTRVHCDALIDFMLGDAR